MSADYYEFSDANGQITGYARIVTAEQREATMMEKCRMIGLADEYFYPSRESNWLLEPSDPPAGSVGVTE